MVKTDNVAVSENFLKFFKVLIDSKTAKEIMNIDILLKDEWLKEVINDIEKYRTIFKNDFKILYETIIDDNEVMNKVNTEYEYMVDVSENEVFASPQPAEIEKGIENKSDLRRLNQINNIYEQNILNDINNLNINEGNFFKPRKDQFNYLKINIINKINRDIKEAIKTFREEFAEKIKKNIKRIIKEKK